MVGGDNNVTHYRKPFNQLDGIIGIIIWGGESPPHKKGGMMSILKKNALIMLLIIIADSLFTVYLVTCGHGEANPMLNWYMQIVGVVGMAITKIAGSTILLIVLIYFDIDNTEKYLGWGIKAYLIIFSFMFLSQFILY